MFNLKNVTVLTKAQQKKVRGGDAFYCECNNGKTFTSAVPPTLDRLIDAINSICGESGGGCTRTE